MGRAVGLAVLDHLLAAGKALDEFGVAPGRVDFQARVQHVGSEMEAHLVVAAAGRSVEEDADALALQLAQHSRHGDRAGDAGGVPVAALVTRLRLDHFQSGFGQGLLPRHDGGGLRSATQHPVAHGVEVLLVGLAQVHRVAADRETLFAKPVRHGAAIEAAGDSTPNGCQSLIL